MQLKCPKCSDVNKTSTIKTKAMASYPEAKAMASRPRSRPKQNE